MLLINHPANELPFSEKVKAGFVDGSFYIDTDEDDEFCFNSPYFIRDKLISRFKCSFISTNKHNFGSNAHFKRIISYPAYFDDLRYDFLSFRSCVKVPETMIDNNNIKILTSYAMIWTTHRFPLIIILSETSKMSSENVLAFKIMMKS